MIDDYFGEIFFTLIVLTGFIIHWLAVSLNWQKLQPVSKPLAMVLLIAWTVLLVPRSASWSLGLLIAAQIFGLIGDIFLLFRGKWFLFGMAAFMVGHLFYIGTLLVALIDFFQDGSEISRLPIKVLVYMMTSAGILIFFYWMFKPMRNPDNVHPPVWAAEQVYSWVLSELVAMSFFFVLLLGSDSLQPYFLPLGAFLFLFSDTLLAYNKFIQPFQTAHIWEIMTYHLAQFSLAIGFLSII